MTVDLSRFRSNITNRRFAQLEGSVVEIVESMNTSKDPSLTKYDVAEEIIEWRRQNL